MMAPPFANEPENPRQSAQAPTRANSSSDEDQVRAAWALGRLEEAKCLAQSALARAPSNDSLRLLLAEIFLASGDRDQATMTLIEGLQANGDSFPLRAGLAGLLAEHDDVLALEWYARALEICPSAAETWSNHGLTLARLGQFEQAIQSFSRAIQLRPNFYPAWNNRGAAWNQLGQTAEAMADFRIAADLSPDFVPARRNLGVLLAQNGRLGEALNYLERALALAPSDADLAADLASAYREAGREVDAVTLLQTIHEGNPSHSRVARGLAMSLASLDRSDEAAAVYRRSARHTGDRLSAFLADCGTCPLVFDSTQAIDDYRALLTSRLRGYLQDGWATDWRSLADHRVIPPFTLDHHGRDNRDIKCLYAQILGREIPDLVPTSGGRDRLGIVVTQGHEGVFVRSFAGALVRRWEVLEPVILGTAATCERIRRSLGDAIAFVVLPDSIERAALTIRSHALAAIYHWEIGTDSWSYYLPLLRLAPLQLTSFGVQDTSGMPNIDVYLSSELLEPPDAQNQYSEQLVRMACLPAFVRPQPLPRIPVGRERFGLSPAHHVYLCPQRVAKLHPDFDAAMAQILRTDPDGVIVLPAGRVASIADRLMDRIGKRYPDIAPRVRFLREPRGDEYYSLILAADVVLDTWHYGGVNTVYDSFAMGKIVMTLPGPFQRSRYARGCYERMGFHDPVAASPEHYVDVACRIAQDWDYRWYLEEKLRERRSVLFEDAAVGKDLEKAILGLLGSPPTAR